MSSKRYPEEFKIEALKQITENRYPIAEVSKRLGVWQHSPYQWLKQYGLPESEHVEAQSQQAELKRVTEERDILKKAAAHFAKDPQGAQPGRQHEPSRQLRQ